MADSVDTQATASSEQDTQQQGQQKSFTQEEVDKLMGKLRRETKSKYADYDSLKEKAAKPVSYTHLTLPTTERV